MPNDTLGLSAHIPKRLIEDLDDLEVHLITNRTVLTRRAIEDLVAKHSVEEVPLSAG
ncbi:MAG TPA: hypothetical protein VNV87_12830 [Acidimicrobiales bacterium]|jgi:hypothetical protein|nr:hypothetical protein [Acidimicrobiales bacterium]